jgi:hypothetical protein
MTLNVNGLDTDQEQKVCVSEKTLKDVESREPVKYLLVCKLRHTQKKKVV